LGILYIISLIFNIRNLANKKAREAGHVAGSSGHWIGRVNGLDQPNNNHFAKKSFYLAKIDPTLHGFIDEPLNF
jgi:hypothetical protein